MDGSTQRWLELDADAASQDGLKLNIPPRSGGRQPWDDPERGGVKTRSLVRVPAVEVFGAALLVWIDGSVEQTGYRSLDVRPDPVACQASSPGGQETKELALLPFCRWTGHFSTNVLVPLYQRLAGVVAALRVKGWSDQPITVKVGVTDKTIAKALRWLRRTSGFQAR